MAPLPARSWLVLPVAALVLTLVLIMASACSTAEPEPVETSAAATSQPDADSAGPAEPRESTELPPLEPAGLDAVLPIVCDFERYNGLYVKTDATDEDPVGYEQSLEVFVRLVLGDLSLPTDAAAAPAIAQERSRCAALPNLTFANGSHPVIKQIAATEFRSIVPAQEDCSWRRTDEDGDVAEATATAGSTITIDVEPSDRSVRIDGCGVFVAGTPPVERVQP